MSGDKKSLVYVPFLGINISKAFETQLIKTVIPYRKKQLPVGDAWREFLKRFRVEGFSRHPHLAPDHIIFSIVQKHWIKHQSLFMLVIASWAEEKKDLFKKITTWFEGDQARQTLVQSENILPEDIVGQLADQYCGEYPENEREEVVFTIAMSKLIEMEPQGNDKQEEQPKGENKLLENEPTPEQFLSSDAAKAVPDNDGLKVKFDHIIQWVCDNLPQDVNENEIEYLLGELRTEILKRVWERSENKRRDAIRDKLQILVQKLSEVEEYFGFEGYQAWNVGGVSKDELDRIDSLVGDLFNALEQHASLKQLEPKTLAERRQLNAQLDQCEEQISQCFAQLDSILLTPPASEEIIDQGEAIDEVPIENEPEIPKDIETVSLQEIPVAESEYVSVETEDQTQTVDFDQLENESVEPLLVPEQGVEEEDLSAAMGEEISIDAQPLPVSLESPVAEAKPLQEVFGESLEEETKEEEVDEEKLHQITQATVEEVDRGPVLSDEIQRRLFKFLEQGDLSRAYWLMRAVEQTGDVPVVPSWLLAGTQGCHWLLQMLPQVPNMLVEDIREIASPARHSVESEHAIWGLNLALTMSLIEPHGEKWEEWLTVDVPSSSLLELITKVEKFINGGGVLDPDIVQRLLGEEQTDQQIKALAKQAQHWLDYAPNRRTRFPGANETWGEITSKKKGSKRLRDWLEPVAQDARERVGEVKDLLDAGWCDKKWVDDYIQQTFRQLKSNKRFTIEGAVRDQMIRWILEAVGIAKRWCELVQSPVLSAEKEWLLQITEEFIGQMRHLLPAAVKEIRDLSLKNRDTMRSGAYKTLARTLIRLGNYLQVTNEPPSNLNLFRPENSLIANLAEPLIFYPPLSLDDMGIPEALDKDALALLARADYSPEQAYRIWVNYKDYRFLKPLEEKIPSTERESLLLWEQNKREEDFRILEAEIQKTQIGIEQALLDGLLVEHEYTEMLNRLESARKAIAQIRSGDQPANLALLYNRLMSLQTVIDRKKTEQQHHLTQKWDELQTRLDTVISSSEDRQKVVHLVATNLQEGNLRVVSELLSQIEESASQKKGFSVQQFSGIDEGSKLKEYIPQARHLIDDLESGRELSAIVKNRTHKLPSDRREEVQKALRAWFTLKGNQSVGYKEKQEYLGTILRYLGFDLAPNMAFRTNDKLLNKFEHWRILLRPRVPAPVPQFGSERYREAGKTGRAAEVDFAPYDVVGVWDRPGPAEIESFATKINKRPAIMLYFGRLLPQQRLDLARVMKNNQIPMLMVDDVLMTYLAGEYDVRLNAMFECTLPYAYVNPYTPFATGSVPQEMFFGRESEINQLMQPYGPAIVYGGRQLGKSALLKQVQRRFHKADPKKIAIFEDIRLIGKPDSGQDYRREILDRLTNDLIEEEVFPSGRVFDDFNKFSDAVIRQVRQKGYQILVLLDEADSFLEADAAKDFFVVSQLKRIMDQTDRRFKVVFAGLHHVQQFKNIPNQPLSHLGDAGAIEVGPLEPRAAFELIHKPLKALGYVFGNAEKEDLSLIFLILSFTNYHPGLLQLFGHHLVEHLNRSTVNRTKHPPYSITRSDIESIYHNPQVRETIQDRFNITLKLDERYEAIALSLILAQLDDQNGFDRLYTPEELYKICHEDWPAGFEDVRIDKFKGFLEEMRGLGVLSVDYGENGNRKYRLRSPNLVSLMGTRDQIIERLDKVTKSKPLSQERRLESYRDFIDPYFSPLTYSQASLIQGKRSGVCLVFGSPATSISTLSDALNKMAKQNKWGWKEIHIKASTSGAIQTQLRNLVKENKGSKRMVLVFRDLEGYSENEMVDQIREAVKECRHTNGLTLRVVFQLGPYSTWRWFQLPPEERLKIEQDEVDVVMVLNRWDVVGIRQILERHDPEWSVSDRVIDKILQLTGGWPVLMDRFIDFGRGVLDPDQPCQRLKQEILDNPQEIKKFINDLGILDERARQMISQRIMIGKELSEEVLKDTSSDEILKFMDFDPAKEAWLIDYLRRLSVLTDHPHFPVEPLVAKVWNDTNEA